MLPLARYRFTARLQADLRLPDYAGSVLRSAFGASLREASCTTGAPHCDRCPVLATCPYAQVFETPAPADHALQHFSKIPNPYVIEPPAIGTRHIAAGRSIQFKMVLVGHAVERLPLIAFSWQRALATGLGRERARSVMERIEWIGAEGSATPIWQTGDATIAPHPATPWHSMHTDNVPAAVTLRFETPLRLQQQGKALRPDRLTPRKLVADLLRRISLLAEFHAGLPPHWVGDVSALVAHADTLAHSQQLSWFDWSRYSSRQGREMPLGGVLGNWTLRGELAPLLPWLRLGEWLHVGKNATLGLGHYRLLKADDRALAGVLNRE